MKEYSQQYLSAEATRQFAAEEHVQWNGSGQVKRMKYSQPVASLTERVRGFHMIRVSLTLMLTEPILLHRSFSLFSLSSLLEIRAQLRDCNYLNSDYLYAMLNHIT